MVRLLWIIGIAFCMQLKVSRAIKSQMKNPVFSLREQRMNSLRMAWETTLDLPRDLPPSEKAVKVSKKYPWTSIQSFLSALVTFNTLLKKESSATLDTVLIVLLEAVGAYSAVHTIFSEAKVFHRSCEERESFKANAYNRIKNASLSEESLSLIGTWVFAACSLGPSVRVPFIIREIPCYFLSAWVLLSLCEPLYIETCAALFSSDDAVSYGDETAVELPVPGNTAIAVSSADNTTTYRSGLNKGRNLVDIVVRVASKICVASMLASFIVEIYMLVSSLFLKWRHSGISLATATRLLISSNYMLVRFNLISRQMLSFQMEDFQNFKQRKTIKKKASQSPSDSSPTTKTLDTALKAAKQPRHSMSRRRTRRNRGRQDIL
jgi:hypothetical protein